MGKRLLCTILALCLLIPAWQNNSTAYAAQNEDKAVLLQSMGLLSGSGSGFDLDRAAKRVEMAVMMCKLLGMEAKAAAQNVPHPFTDVPDWAKAPVAWMYEEGYINGSSATTYSPMLDVDINQFLTLLLTVMDYKVPNWQQVLSYSVTIGFLTQSEADAYAAKPQFLRDDMAALCYKALTFHLYDSRRTLAQKLQLGRVFTEAQGIAAGVLKGFDPNDYFAEMPLHKSSMFLKIHSDTHLVLGFEPAIPIVGGKLYMTYGGNWYEEIPQGERSDGKPYYLTMQADPYAPMQGADIYNLQPGVEYEFLYVLHSTESERTNSLKTALASAPADPDEFFADITLLDSKMSVVINSDNHMILGFEPFAGSFGRKVYLSYDNREYVEIPEGDPGNGSPYYKPVQSDPYAPMRGIDLYNLKPGVEYQIAYVLPSSGRTNSVKAKLSGVRADPIYEFDIYDVPLMEQTLSLTSAAEDSAVLSFSAPAGSAGRKVYLSIDGDFYKEISESASGGAPYYTPVFESHQYSPVVGLELHNLSPGVRYNVFYLVNGPRSNAVEVPVNR